MNTKKLKQLVLDLAIHGKLVPQDPNDEPASELLKRIVETHGRASNIGRASKQTKTKSAISSDILNDVPFEVPEGWVWCRLNDLAFYKKGPFGSSLTKSMFVTESDSTYKVYEQKNAIQKDASLGSYFISKEKFEELKGFEVYSGDIIVSCAGTIGETYVLPSEIKKGIINQALMLVRLYSKDIQDFYLMCFDYMLKQQATSDSKGTAIKNIPPFEILKAYPIPLPPLSEQRRIVLEIEKWFGIIDQLESNEADLRKSIEQTKKKVLDLAIHGKLVPQDPNDEPASELLKRIVETHGRASNIGRASKQTKTKSAISSDNLDEVPFDVPEGWCWTIVKNICSKIGSGSTPRGSNYSDEGIPFFRSQNIYNEGLVYDDIKYISEETHLSMIGTEVKANDILLNITGGSLGRCAVVPNDFKRGNVSQHVCILRTIEVLPSYLHSFIISDFFSDTMILSGSGREGLPKYSLEAMPIPLPPLSEQKRIVRKIEEVFWELDRIVEMIG